MGNLRYAVHAYAWTTSWSNETLDLIDHAKNLEFDVIEIPLMEIDLVDAAAIKARAAKVGIGLCTSVACSEDADPTSPQDNIRENAKDFLRKCVDATADMGATVFSGVIYSAIGGRIDGRPGPEYWRRSAEVLRETARYAAQRGVTIGIEPVNRYETYLVNTCDQALRLREMIGEPNVGIHLDAYHMNIEEQDFHNPTIKAAPHLCHYHLSESHRGTPGTGVVDWHEIYKALAEAKYSGVVGLESFCEVSDAMRAATCIWRDLAPSSDELLSNGLGYLRSLEAKYCG